MGSKLENSIEHEGSTLEKHVTPVPTIVLDDIMSLRLYPQVEPNQGNSSEPPTIKVLVGETEPRQGRNTSPRAFRTTGLPGSESKQMRTCSTTKSHLNVQPISPKLTRETQERT